MSEYGEWQPIETAPMGKDILVYCPNDFRAPEITIFAAHSVQTKWFGCEWSISGVMDRDSDEWNKWKRNLDTPTHWMPLPPLPEGVKE